MSGAYEGRQIVGMDLHRRRSVLVRMTETGEALETVRIANDPKVLREVMARAGERPEVVLEATYGWYWAGDTLAELGASVHLAHPLGVKAFSYRRVKNDQRDAADLADLLRMGRPSGMTARHSRNRPEPSVRRSPAGRGVRGRPGRSGRLRRDCHSVSHSSPTPLHFSQPARLRVGLDIEAPSAAFWPDFALLR